MENKVLYRGTTFEFYTNDESINDIQKYMLVELNDEEFIFQIVCLTGYYAGTLNGYVKNEDSLKREKIAGITIEHLKEELNRNIEDINWDSFKLLPA